MCLFCDASQASTSRSTHAVVFVMMPERRLWSHPLTADAYLKAEETILKMHSKTNRREEDAYVIGLIIYADKTTSRTIGAREFYPIYLSIANVCDELFHSHIVRTILGYLPVIKTPPLSRSRKGGKSYASNAARRRLSVAKETIMHHFWSQIVLELDTLRKVGIQATWKGIESGERGVAWLYPTVLFLNGDYPELQAACGCSPSANCQFPCRMCFTLMKEENVADERETPMPRTLAAMAKARVDPKLPPHERAKLGVATMPSAWINYRFVGNDLKVRG